MEKFVLHQKTYDFVLWLYPIINRLPKHHRLVLGRKLEDQGLTLLTALVKANNARGSTRKIFQQEGSDKLDLLRILMRLTKDTHLMSVKQYIEGTERLNEIGRMLNFWMSKTKCIVEGGKN